MAPLASCPPFCRILPAGARVLRRRQGEMWSDRLESAIRAVRSVEDQHHPALACAIEPRRAMDDAWMRLVTPPRANTSEEDALLYTSRPSALPNRNVLVRERLGMWGVCFTVAQCHL